MNDSNVEYSKRGGKITPRFETMPRLGEVGIIQDGGRLEGKSNSRSISGDTGNAE